MKSWVIGAIIAVLVIAVAIVAYEIGSKSAPLSETSTLPSTESNTDSAASKPPVEVQKLFTIDIEDSSFNPSELKITPGSNVTWVNKDSIPHSLVSDSGSKSGIGSGIMEEGNKYTVQFITTGTYAYHCKFHNEERGKIVVE